MKIRYDGTNYHGWQVQKNAMSVQEVFQNSLEKVYGERLAVKGCSRTDTGVHALMFCISYKAPYFTDEYHTLSAVNNFLPPDIKAFECEEVEEDFHARYSALGKEYIYLVYNAKYPNPFYDKYSLSYKYHIDADKLNEAAKFFIGTHDFAAFCSAHSDVEDTRRTIYDFNVERKGDLVYFKVSGNGFLYNMVRIMVGTLLMVASDKIKPSEIENIIEKRDRKSAGKTVPAKGLFLNKVFYEGR